MDRQLAALCDLQPERVCLIKPSSLGDIVNALPVLEALRARWPGAAFTWVVNRALRGLLEGHPALDELVVYDRSRAVVDPAGIARFVKDLRGRRFDLAIDLQGLLRSGIMAAATGAHVRVGLADAREGATRFYTHRVAVRDPDAHAVDRLLWIAASFGADTSVPRYDYPIPEETRRWARGVLSTVSSPRLVLNLGARWKTKRWPTEHFAEIARRAVAFGAGLVVVGAADDRPLVESFRGFLGDLPFLDLCGLTTLPQLAAVASDSELVVSNDTGPLHLAAAAGARVVGIYTCSSPKRNGPYGPRASAVATQVWCAASHLRRCGRLDCFRELTPDRVWPVVSAQLSANGRCLVRSEEEIHWEASPLLPPSVAGEAGARG